MTISEMLGQSGVLTLLGMSVVFSFLVILVLFISLAGKIIVAGAKETLAPAYSAAGPVAVAAAVPAGNDGQVTAVISAAISEYRKNH